MKDLFQQIEFEWFQGYAAGVKVLLCAQGMQLSKDSGMVY